MSFYESINSANEFALADLQTLAAYRAWAFPPQVQCESHQPHFSLHEPETWVTIDGLALFKAYCASLDGTVPLSPPSRIASPAALGAYKQYLLPPHLAALPFFDAVHYETWLSPGAFNAFASTTANTPIATSLSVNGIERKIKGSQRAATGVPLISRFVIDLAEDDSDDEWFDDAVVSVAKNMCEEGIASKKRGHSMC
ncbi:hypothetical protein EXIGLDRAFT_759360 [Exidia glandulosa HHB12029]|uniref:Uncharacterized protein n=1 Tax=Exidia glandulosa HHB12029 TaxID=1314781 RepID=A0A165Q418_EXIGL|nr:hypothetical protein EXIGLDRAFT_759360 [Exidia glandulosa HHB12029]